MALFTVTQLDQYLTFKSYILGYQPSMADLAVFESVSKSEIDSSTNFNVKRWYKHMESFTSEEKATFQGMKEVPSDLVNYKNDPSEKKPSTTGDDDDDFDLFGDDGDDSAKQAVLEKAKAAAKKNKPAVIAKSTIVFDIKPIDDETDLEELRTKVLSIKKDGLIWGESKLEDICFGLKKLVVSAEIEDAKISTDDLEEQITSFEDHVQSVDIAAFQKV